MFELALESRRSPAFIMSTSLAVVVNVGYHMGLNHEERAGRMSFSEF